jgi:hypothetical protein
MPSIGTHEDWEAIPVHLRGGLGRYLHQGILPGSFLRAALSNDFVMAACAADDETVQHLPKIARFLVNVCPSQSWGSEAAMRDWSAQQQKRVAMEGL